ncbi:MAG TPA: helix-turn-helix domain-containing protein [Ferruginibacter sp.]|nr:helix-turn-helix domain-containing protein [Ferruginibacter sp.]
MKNSQIIISGLTPDDLVELFRPMIQEEVNRIKGDQEEKLLSPAETCKMFQPSISKVTLASWTKQGLINDHRIGGRVYYKQSEILSSLQTLKKYKTVL